MIINKSFADIKNNFKPKKISKKDIERARELENNKLTARFVNAISDLKVQHKKEIQNVKSKLQNKYTELLHRWIPPYRYEYLKNRLKKQYRNKLKKAVNNAIENSKPKHDKLPERKLQSSVYRGVMRVKPYCYYANIYDGTKLLFLGSFANEIDAALAYDDKAKQMFGENAKLNFINNGVYH